MKILIIAFLSLALVSCGYVSGVGLNYDPNTGVVGGSVTFPVGGDYKQVVKAKRAKHKTTKEFK